MPDRIQRQRTKGWQAPKGAVYVGRPTIFGNPFPVSTFGREQAVALYRTWLTTGSSTELGYDALDAEYWDARRAVVMDRLPALRGRDLMCWCSLPAPYGRDWCHADVLLELANA